MANETKRLPFATFALTETDASGVILQQNRIAQKVWGLRKSTCLCHYVRQTPQDIARAIAQNGYAVALARKDEDTAALVFAVAKDRLWWMAPEEMRQSTTRDAFLSRCDAISAFAKHLPDLYRNALRPNDEEKAERDFSAFVRAGLNAQRHAQELVDAVSFVDGLFLPALHHGGVAVTSHWTQLPAEPMPVSLANLAMTLTHIAQMFAADHRQINWTFCAEEDAVTVTAQGAKPKKRHTASALRRRFALDFALMDGCLSREDCQITWDFADKLTCQVQFACDCSAVAYLGSDSHRLMATLSQLEAELTELFSKFA